jgi:hypothetical protein
MSAETQEAAPFDEWVICELMGRVRLAGRMTEQQIAGGHFMRLDIHKETGPAVITQLIPPPPGGPVYRITITTEAVARKIGARSVPEPVARWELEAAKPWADHDQDDDLGDDDDDPEGTRF